MFIQNVRYPYIELGSEFKFFKWRIADICLIFNGLCRNPRILFTTSSITVFINDRSRPEPGQLHRTKLSIRTAKPLFNCPSSTCTFNINAFNVLYCNFNSPSHKENVSKCKFCNTNRFFLFLLKVLLIHDNRWYII